MIRHFLDWFCLEGRGYQFWSGIGSGSPILASVYLLLRQHTCRQRRCLRLVWGHHDGIPLCRRHHPSG